tara:strand:+ start:114 stop:827 length:714 start_codon:yes stop_codon:yes gene_type:complete
MKKYVVIDTWNGEGYSTENGVDIKQFDYRKSALKWAYKRALTNAQDDADDVQRYSDQKDHNGEPLEWFKKDGSETNGDGYFWETYDDDSGSYQVWETKDVHAFMIQCNVNDVTPLTKKQFIEEIEDKEDLMKDAITHSDFNESEEDFQSQEENGDVYYGGLDFEDYDYQYRLVSNMKGDSEINSAIAEDEVTPVYIDFLNKEKGFKKDRIKFDSYELAVKWAKTNLEKFNHDMIKYE